MDLASSQVPRPALMQRLDNLLEKRIIYVHAPAGFGKTVSSFLWLEHKKSLASIKQAWVSLDEHDDKTSEFCRRFISALVRLQPENTALGELAAQPAYKTAPVEFTLYTIGTFNETPEEYVLVLDDLHVINNGEILNLLPILFKRMPGNFTILLLSRTAPPDSFSEIVAKGELAVVDTGHLQFTSEEIKNFFDNNGKPISSMQANEILASTGGWAIGIRALLLSEEKFYKTKLTDSYLENFLKKHVWERWDDRFRSFMMLVSIVEELTPELCEQLITGSKIKASGTEMLGELARDNAFLRIVGSNTYKFHDLFREFLMHMLGQKGEQAVSKQYNKAGEFFYGKKDYFRSVKYYSKAKNNDGVAKSLYQMYDYNSPYASVEDTLNTARAALNDTIVASHPFLLEVQIWGAFVEGHAEEFENYLDKYYKLLPKIILKNPRSAIIQMLLRIADYRNNFVDTLKTIRMVPFKENVRAYTPSITQSIPLFHRSSRDYSDILNDMDKNLALAKKSIGIVIGEEWIVIEECIRAGFHYEKGNINEAQAHALDACAKIPDSCSSEIKFCAMVILTASLLAAGQTASANKALSDIEDMIKRDNAFYLNPNFRAYKFELKLMDGDKSAANEWLLNYSESPYNHLPFYKMPQHFTTARAYIVTGDNNRAILLLKKLLALVESYNRPIDIIEVQILLAIAHWKKRRSGLNIALDYLERAIKTAYKYKYTQLFANEGAELTTMLHRFQKRVQHSSYSDEFSADFVKSLYIAAVAGAKNFKGLTGGRPPENLNFTDKQKAVMRLMCLGHSRNEIATQLGLKPYGVKSHTTLIYNKLNVSNGVEAVLKINELSLLDDYT
ncbi:MAG: LuxR C-terminal-related transcriptional regulator [Defluviitaleaceae bacterium]|nr:LuxR C-terminal-related transcriptional regulator [Defluviitaleaceae bacterium]